MARSIRDNISSETASYTPSTSASQPVRKPIQVVRRLKDDVCLSQDTKRNDEDSASSLCSNFMAAWG